MASEVLSAIPIPSSILQSLLEDVKIKVDSRDSSPARKRPRTDSARSSPGVLSEELSQSMRHLTLILEVLEQQHPEEHAELIPSLINLLDRLVTVESDTRTTLSYPKQMVLSCLISMVGGLKVSPVLALSNCSKPRLRGTNSELIPLLLVFEPRQTLKFIIEHSCFYPPSLISFQNSF